MAKFSISDKIGDGLCDNRPYAIYCVSERGGNLIYWYLVISDDTYDTLHTEKNRIERDKMLEEITDKAVDVRIIKGYTGLNTLNLTKHRTDVIVPLLKEAVTQGVIQPL